jgi:hypothetical protein
MRHRRPIRNPRYAPEFLEKKLSPTDLTGGLTTSVLVSSTTTPLTTTITSTDTPPVIYPTTTSGGCGPA